MSRLLSFTCLCVALGATGTARGQTMTPMTMTCPSTFTASLVRIEGPGGLSRADDELFRPLGIAHCDARDQVSLIARYQGAPATSWLDTWLGREGENCFEVSRRGGVGPLCQDLMTTDLQNPPQTTEGVSFALTDLTAVGIDPCTGAGGIFWLFLLGSNTTASTGEVTEYGCIAFEIDTTRPPTPVVKSTSLAGSSQVRLGWEIQDSRDVERYAIFADTSGASCADADPAAIVAGTPLMTVQQGSSETSISLGNLGLTMDGERAVIIVSQDRARNYSEPSQVVCVRRVPTRGFCDNYEAESGEPCSQECSVLAPGLQTRSRLAVLAGLLVAAVFLFRRRRTS